MPKIPYSNGQIKMVKHHFSKSKLKLILVLIASFLSVVFLAYACSGMLTISEFSWDALFMKNTVTMSQEKQYAIVMNKYSGLEQAQEMAEVFALQGAGANVWQVDTWYYVLGNSYPSLSDVESVKNNIITSNPDVFIYEFSIVKVSLKLSNFSAEQKTVVSRALNHLKDITDAVYRYTLAIDEQSLTPTTVSSLVNTLKSDTVIISNQLDVLHSVQVHASTIQIKNTYLAVIEVLNELILKLIGDDQNNHTVKYSFLNLLQLRMQLHQNLQSF